MRGCKGVPQLLSYVHQAAISNQYLLLSLCRLHTEPTGQNNRPTLLLSPLPPSAAFVCGNQETSTDRCESCKMTSAGVVCCTAWQLLLPVPLLGVLQD